jgi:hypothetical protein
VTPNSGGNPADAGGHVERDTPMTGIYVRVLILEAAIVVALWYFGRMFS